MLTRALKTRFAASLRRLLRPIVRQAIRWGVGYPTVNQILREVFVEVAERDFALPFKRQTDSRIALVSGLTRKEVAQLRKRGAPRGETPEVEDTVITHVIGRWMAGPPYADTRGAPKPLPYDSDDAGQPTFSTLVRDLGVDLPVRAVLDELVNLRSVELTAHGNIVLRQQAHIPTEGVEGKLTILGSDPAELFMTVAHNIDDADAPWLQRKVVYDNIGSDALPALEAESRRLGEEFLQRANALLSSYDRDRNPQAPGGSRARVVLGAYYFQEVAAPPDAKAETKPARVPPGRIRRNPR